MSLLEKIRNARRKLNAVETTVTFEDGSTACERRSADGSFSTIAEPPSESAVGDSEGSAPTCIVVPIRVTSASSASSPAPSAQLSNKQLKARLRRQKYGYVVDLNPDLQMANVSRGVFLGSQDVAHDLDILSAHKVTHIVNCATGVKNIFVGKIRYLTVDVLDLPWTNLQQYFDTCHVFMRKCVEAGGNVLVHCNAGISRSATIVISYIMKYDRKSLQEALDHVNSIRRVSPNPGFMQQLLSYESTLKGGN